MPQHNYTQLLSIPFHKAAWFWVVAGVLIVSGCLFCAIFSTRPALRVDAGAPGDTALLEGFWQPETRQGTTYRWSTAHARLHLPISGPYVLTQRLNGQGLYTAGTPRYALQHTGQSSYVPVAFDLAPEWRQYHTLLPPQHPFFVLTGITPPIELQTTTFVPDFSDPRQLGFMIDWLELTPLSAGWRASLLPAWHALLLTWGLALLAAAVWYLPAPRAAQHLPGSRSQYVVLLTAVLALVLVVWAYVYPYNLLRVLPVNLWVLLPLSAGLLAVHCRHYGLAAWVASLAVVLYPWLSLAVQWNYPGDNDAVFYYTVAESLASGRGFQVDYIWHYLSQPAGLPHPANDYWMPLTAVIISLSMNIFGIHLLAAILPGIVCAVALSLLTYVIGKICTGSSFTAWAAACLLLFLEPVLHAALLPETMIYYAFFVAASLLCMILGRSDWRFFAPAAICAGLAYLTRQDGILLLPVLLLAIITTTQTRRNRLTIAVLALACVVVVLLPWLALNYQTFGSLFPKGPSRTLFLTSYEDLYVYSRELSLHTYLQSGIAAIVEARLHALAQVPSILLNLADVILWVFVLLSGLAMLLTGRQRHVWHSMLPMFGYLMLLIAFYTLIAVFPGTFSLPRSLLACLPFLLVLAIDGMRNMLRWRWLTVLALLALAIHSLHSGIGAHTVQMQHYHERAQGFAQVGAVITASAQQPPEDTVIMTRYPWGVHYVTGASAIQIPNEDRATILAVACQFGADYLLLGNDTLWQRVALAGLYDEPATDARFELIADFPYQDNKLFRIRPGACQ
jgi:hypothetical protein